MRKPLEESILYFLKIRDMSFSELVPRTQRTDMGVRRTLNRMLRSGEIRQDSGTYSRRVI